VTMTSDFTLASEPRIWRLRITERLQALRNWVTSETETPSFAPASGEGYGAGTLSIRPPSSPGVLPLAGVLFLGGIRGGCAVCARVLGLSVARARPPLLANSPRDHHKAVQWIGW